LKLNSIRYTVSLEGVTAERLQGFFVGWPDPPSPETHLRILAGSWALVLAIEAHTGRIVGFITAISDGISAAYIPYVEVLPEHQGCGIGSELVRRMLVKLRDLYMVDLICDPDIQPFYERLGMRRYSGMILRNYDRQAGN
jgi:ribosomal protein S18 acetylase RimI-like enzyme